METGVTSLEGGGGCLERTEHPCRGKAVLSMVGRSTVCGNGNAVETRSDIALADGDTKARKPCLLLTTILDAQQNRFLTSPGVSTA
jgi:hypothetical protein